MTIKSTIGIDTGGTFTDFVWLDAAGRWQIHKELSTPHDPSQAILSGLSRPDMPTLAAIVHGSTVATNALLERRGAKTALITTRGFADVLAIGRQNRPDIYALVPRKAPPLVPTQWRFEVTERVTSDGQILEPLDPAGLRPLIQHLQAEEIESVAICLLFSFLRPEHEQQIAASLRQQLPHLHLSLSTLILPEYREYERTATTVINAYVAPLMSRYLQRLGQGVAPRPLAIMQSNGGIISPTTAAAQAARTALSGPAGGVVGARFVAEAASYPNIITFDMGGTSTDVALCPGRTPTTTKGEIAGLPLRLPIIAIHTVGAGGGSLAWLDAGRALHVGPQSAGANPGPACYGRGGRQATTTDANLLLGRLDADHFLGGQMKLDETAGRVALSQLAQEMGADSPEQAAWDLLQVANAIMERAIRAISVERGYDPRLFTLLAFGGAGPLHACELADNLQIPRVLIPAVPGVLSALGMLVAAPTKDYSQTVLATTEADLTAPFAALQARAVAEMAAEGYDPAGLQFRPQVDMRYRGQSHELTVDFGPQLAGRFHQAHQQRYGYHRPEAPIERVTVRLTVSVAQSPPPLPRYPAGTMDPALAVVGPKTVWFDGRPGLTTRYRREWLPAGQQLPGPAIIFQYDTTTVVPAGWQATVDPFRNLILEHFRQ